MKFYQLSIVIVIFISINLLLPTLGAGFNQSCNKSPCNHTLGLQCQHRRSGGGDKVCLCPQYSHYYPETGRCSLNLGDQCGRSARSHSHIPLDKQCPPLAYCTSLLERIIPEEYLPIVVKIGNRMNSKTLCTCNHQAHFHPDVIEGCIPFLKFGDKCNKTEKLHICNHNQDMVCGKPGNCECLAPTTFDKELDRCVMPLGGYCEHRPSVYYNICGKNAISSKVLGEVKYVFHKYIKQSQGYDPSQRITTLKSPDTCVCFPGFSSNAKGECVKTMRGACSANSPCNKDLFLSCIDGMCHCSAGTMSTYLGANGCRLIPGAKCSLTEGPKCMEGTICINSHCSCKAGYSKGDGRQFCMLDYGTKCNMSRNSEQCNYFNGLACIDGVCSCFDSSLKWNKMECIAQFEGTQCGEILMEKYASVNRGQDNFEDIIMSYTSGTPEERQVSSREEAYIVRCAEGLECSWHGQSYGMQCNKKQRH